MWIGGAALLATAAIVGITMRGGDGEADPASTRTPAATPQASAKADPREVGKPPAAAPIEPAEPTPAEPTPAEPTPAEPTPDAPTKAEPTPDAPTKAADEPEIPAGDAPDDAEAAADPAPEPPEPVGDAPARPALAAAPASADYDTAKAEDEASGSQDALATMVKAACAMDDGPSARAAFRKLKPTELRKDALSACKKTLIDPTSSVEGSTPAELVRRARRELQAGDAAAAMSTARESNRLKRSSDAIAVMVLAACAQSDAEEARRLRKHVAKDDRAEVDEACAAKGIDPTAPAE